MLWVEGTKRRAKRLPKLIADLESARDNLAHSEEAFGDASGQLQADEGLQRKAAEYIERAKEYRSEFEANGSIEDPFFDGWYREAKAFARSMNKLGRGGH